LFSDIFCAAFVALGGIATFVADNATFLGLAKLIATLTKCATLIL
jgi:uncharacterized membrane-anchored protein